jgi:RND family efflux transporter MFP subunit
MPPPSPEVLEIPTVLSVEREIDVVAQRDGFVREVAREQGALVAKGALLCRLDDRDLVADRDRARAGQRVAENNVKYNEAELKAKQAGFRRAQELLEAGLLSRADYEKAEFEAKGAEFDLESWRANVERSQAELRRLEVDLEKTRLTAAFPGVVARWYVREGQVVRKDDKCLRLAQLAPLQARFLVPEAAQPRPVVGAPIRVALGTNGRTAAAKVRRVSPIVDAASAGIEVLAELTGPGLDDLRPGMAVRVLWRSAADR